MKYFIISGEQSGDLHGSNLVKELVRSDQQAEIKCWGGDLMEAAGAKLLMHNQKITCSVQTTDNGVQS
jgi:lipid-A-disaccharide synthase